MKVREPPGPAATGSVTVPGDALRRIPVHAWMVEVVAGPARPAGLTGVRGLVRVGSDPGCDLVLEDPAVSRRHLELEPGPRGLLVRDLGSRNGTRLGGRLVREAFAEPGDLLDLGKSRLALRRAAGPEEVEVEQGESFGELVGASAPMALAFAELAAAARTGAALLLEGEPGTGKELAARAVHARSARHQGPLLVVDCGQRDTGDLERELLSPRGALATAREGTLVLDEVGDLHPALQPRLLRALEAGGGPRTIATTARNLDQEVAQGRLRPGLLHRLAVLRVRLPPLRSHREDLPLLLRHLGRALPAPLEPTPQLLGLLEAYHWPGNVRELRQILERGAILQAAGAPGWAGLVAAGPGEAAVDAAGPLPYHQARDQALAGFERRYLEEALRASGHEVAAAAARTGLSVPSLYRLLHKHGLRPRALRATPDRR